MIQAVATRVIAVTLIIAIIVAFTLIFMLGMLEDRYLSLVQAEATCRATADSTCSASGSMPSNWDAPFMVNNQSLSCAGVIHCECNGSHLECRAAS